jgi:NAD(P)-dependent dehydrogenase (short-subunit alcohol dehydrogenase family)
MKLQGNVAVITGGNSGIGFGIAEALKNEGAVGTITGRNQATLDQAVQELGSGFMSSQGDVTNMHDLQRMFQATFDRFGKIDTLVVNAGGIVDGSPMASIAEVTEDNYDRYMNLNLKSSYFTVQQALPYLSDGASIILIGSSAAHRAAPGMTIYAAAKAAVISLAKGLSLDLLDRRIRVNALSPGSIDTPVFGKIVPAAQLEQVKQAWKDLIPLGRMGLPSEMGKAVVFLASQDSSFIVGTELLADGGMTNISLMN